MDGFRLPALAILACMAAAPAAATTLPFNVIATFSTTELAVSLDGTPGFVADTCDLFSGTEACDAVTEAETTPFLSVNWVDPDSFDLQFFLNTQDVNSISEIEFAMSGLESFFGTVTGFLLNRADSNLDGFLQSDDNPEGALFDEPTLSFTGDTVSAEFGNYSGQLDGDVPTFRFDVSKNRVEPPSPVPLPAGFGLLLGGLALLGAAGRRKA